MKTPRISCDERARSRQPAVAAGRDRYQLARGSSCLYCGAGWPSRSPCIAPSSLQNEASGQSVPHSGCALAGAIRGGVAGSAMGVRIACASTDSVMKATFRICDTHLEQLEGSAL